MRVERLTGDRAQVRDLGAGSVCAKEFGYYGPRGRCERYFKNESDMIRFGGWMEGHE